MNYLRICLLIIVTYSAALLRYFFDNIFLVSLIASLIYGFCLSLKIKNSFLENLIFFYFLSSFTTFSGFIPYFAELVNDGKYLTFFVHVNLIIILNIFFIYCGFLFGKNKT